MRPAIDAFEEPRSQPYERAEWNRHLTDCRRSLVYCSTRFQLTDVAAASRKRGYTRNPASAGSLSHSDLGERAVWDVSKPMIPTLTVARLGRRCKP